MTVVSLMPIRVKDALERFDTAMLAACIEEKAEYQSF